MPTARVNGIDIHYRDTGGDGFPVVLAHGYTGNSRNWALTVPALREHFRVISPDHRGHGLSHKPTSREDHALDRMADDLHALLGQLAVSECFLVGHSMGGMVAQLLTLAHPKSVRALVLVDTASEVPKNMRSQERRAARQRLVDIAREQGMEAAFEEQLRIAPDAERLRQNPQFVATWREQFLMTSREAFIYCAAELSERRATTDRLGEIRVPTLVICGEKDEPFLEACHLLHEKIAESELVIIPGAGHSPMFETPAEFNAVLTGFLQGVHTGAGAPA